MEDEAGEIFKTSKVGKKPVEVEADNKGKTATKQSRDQSRRTSVGSEDEEPSAQSSWVMTRRGWAKQLAEDEKKKNGREGKEEGEEGEEEEEEHRGSASNAGHKGKGVEEDDDSSDPKESDNASDPAYEAHHSDGTSSV